MPKIEITKSDGTLLKTLNVRGAIHVIQKTSQEIDIDDDMVCFTMQEVQELLHDEAVKGFLEGCEVATLDDREGE